jgi:hypothetical protein
VVAKLTWRVTGKRPAPGLLDVVAGAGGNPFYVTEYTRSLVDAGRIEFGRELASLTVARSEVTRLPTSLIHVVDRRLAGLSARTRDTLPCAAILGPRFSVAELSVTLGVPAFQLLDAVQELLAAGVLVTDADRLAFGHDLTRAAIYESIAPSAREALHLEAAHALARAGAPAERVAGHLLSARTLDAAAVAWTVAAAERLARRAPELATDPPASRDRRRRPGRHPGRSAATGTCDGPCGDAPVREGHRCRQTGTGPRGHESGVGEVDPGAGAAQ